MNKPDDDRLPLVDAVQAEFDRLTAQLMPQLIGRPEPEFANPEIRNLQVAQNVLRTCIEATLQKCLPYSTITCADLAIRLASYAISAAEDHEHKSLVREVVRVLPRAHARRMNLGVRIKAEWERYPAAEGST